MSEASAQSCPSSDTDLVWLHEEKVVSPLVEGGVRIERRHAARILNRGGLEALGSWTVGYRKEDRIETLRGWVIAPDGTARVAGTKEDVVDAPAIAGFSVYEDQRARTLSVRSPVVGAIVAFEDVVVRHLDVGAEPFVFGDADRPTLLSRFELRVPQGFGLEAVALRAAGGEKQEHRDGFVYTFHDLPPLPRDELRPPDAELLPVVWARWWSQDGGRGFRDWSAVARWFDALSSPALAERGEAAEVAARFRPAEPGGILAALERVFAFASREVRYVSIQIGIGGFRPHSPAEVCRNRYGDCKDKAFLLRSIASAWGLTTLPVFVRTRSMGRLVDAVPSPSQFNHCIAGVVLPEGVGSDLWPVVTIEGLGRVALLDATDREGSLWHLPSMDQGTLALFVRPDGGRLARIPMQRPADAATLRRIAASVDEQGRIVGAELTESWTGTGASAVRTYYSAKTDEQRRQDVLESLQDRFPGTSVVGYRIEGLETTDTGVVETTRLAGGRFGSRAGDLLLVSPGKVGYGVVRASLPPPPRAWPLNLGPPREETLEVTIKVPRGWRPEATPRPVELTAPEIEFQSSWTVDDTHLSYRRSARLRVDEVSPERYPAFREAVAAMRAEDARAVALVKP